MSYRKIFLLSVLLLTGCNGDVKTNAVIYLSNHSFDKFDNACFRVYVDDELILLDSVKNQYLSFHWKDSAMKVPRAEFNLKVKVNGGGYVLEKDTVVKYQDSVRLFISFNFRPYYKRYRNPGIYKFIKGETSRLKDIADSLYAINGLPNAEEYLNDTIPLKNNIEISIK